MAQCGVLVTRTMRRKPRLLAEALQVGFQKKKVEFRRFEHYMPCDWLFLYGWGGREQQQAIKNHNGTYIAFDLGYWQREGTLNRKWRVSINGFHCPDLIMRGPHPGSARLAKHKIKIQQKGGDPGGPILLVGSGPKSQKVGAKDWALKMSRTLARQGKEVWYKPKPMRPPEHGIRCSKVVTDDIDAILPKVSLVVCRHSNVAVDACRHGVPVACEDGAASAIYPTLDNVDSQPDFATRVEFMERLAWWQWSITEIRNGDFYPWIREQLEKL